jgi:hypothetical protein
VCVKLVHTMRAVQTRRAVHTVFAAVAVLAAAALVPPATDAAAVGAATTPRSAFVVRSGHVQYESCRASDVTLTVSVARGAFVPGQPVLYTVVLRNDSAYTCTTPLARFTHGPLPLVLGPCSPVPVRITNAARVDVYPGPVSLSCPAFVGAPIPPHQSISDVGTWDQRSDNGNGAQQPPGTYTLTLGGSVRVPVTLALKPQAVPVPVPVPVSPVPTPPKSPGVHPSPRMLTRSAHIGYQGCRGGQVVLSVSISARLVPEHTPLHYTVRLHNTGRAACGPAVGRVSAASRHLSVGPCGALSATVSDHTGMDVYPGSVAYFCPLITPVHLAPRATETASGTWLQDEFVANDGGPAHSRQAPPGSYRLTVAPVDARTRAESVSVPFSIARPTGSHPVPGPTPTILLPGSGASS